MIEERSTENADPSGKTTYVFQDRAGKPGGGKGPLVSNGYYPTMTGHPFMMCVEETEPLAQPQKTTAGSTSEDHRWLNLRRPPLASGRDLFPCLSTALAHWNSGGQESFSGDWYIVEEVCRGS